MLILTQSHDLIVNLDNVLYISIGKGTHTVNAFVKTVDKPVDAKSVMCCLGVYESNEQCKQVLIDIMLAANVKGLTYIMPDKEKLDESP